MTFAFKKLLVYQKAVTFAGGVCSLSREFPCGCFFLADQLNRAAKSGQALPGSIATGGVQGNENDGRRRQI
jgi:hypothetical protein